MSNEKYTKEELKRLVNSEDWKERIEVAYQAGKPGRDDLLERLIDDEDERVRIAVAWAAGRCGKTALLERLIGDEDEVIREEAQKELEDLKKAYVQRMCGNL